MVMFPPRKLRPSIKPTFSPSSAAASAEVNPAGPPPTTNTSYSARMGMVLSGSLIEALLFPEVLKNRIVDHSGSK
jgi:hypothetical protein